MRMMKRSVRFYGVVVLAVVFLLVFAFYFLEGAVIDYFTGNVALDIKEKYKVGEEIKGNLKFKIREGELVPADSDVVVSYAGSEKKYKLSELVAFGQVNGEFYTEGVSISGTGEGYGKEGSKKVFPEVSFDLRITDDEENEKDENNEDLQNESEDDEDEEDSEENEAEDSDEEEDEIEEEGEEIAEDDAEGDSDGDSDDGDVSERITGAAISESEYIVSGKVQKDEDYEYDLENDQTAELVSGSVKVNGEEIDEGEIKVKVGEKKVSVSTKYFISEEGFGEDYLGDKKLELNIDLKKFEFVANSNSALNVKLVYDGAVIVESEKYILVEEKKSEKDNESIANFTETNISILNKTVIDLDDVLLTVTQKEAVLMEPVKWVRRVDIGWAASVTFELPLSAENIQVKKYLSSGDFNTGSFVTGDSIFDSNRELKDVRIGVNGKVTADLDLDESFNIVERLGKLFDSITGYIVSEDAVEVKEIIFEVDGSEEFVEVEYETPASYSFEEDMNNGKKVVIVGPLGVHYEEVLVFANMPESLNIKDPSVVSIYWEEEDNFVLPNQIKDLDEDGVYDYIEWTVPRLSNQTFQILVSPVSESSGSSGGGSGKSSGISFVEESEDEDLKDSGDLEIGDSSSFFTTTFGEDEKEQEVIESVDVQKFVSNANKEFLPRQTILILTFIASLLIFSVTKFFVSRKENK